MKHVHTFHRMILDSSQLFWFSVFLSSFKSTFAIVASVDLIAFKVAWWSEGEACESAPSPRKSFAKITNVLTCILFYVFSIICTFYFWLEGWPRTMHFLITCLLLTSLLHNLNEPSLCCRIKCQNLCQLSKSWLVRAEPELRNDSLLKKWPSVKTLGKNNVIKTFRALLKCFEV